MDITRFHSQKIKKIIPFFLFFTFLTACSQQTAPPPSETKDGVLYLAQGWTMAERQQLSHTSFGSRMLDYNWFLTLELADSETLFRSDAHLDELGFIPEAASEFNPDALPVGFSRDQDGNKSWIGLSCAACHTGQLVINNKTVRIDGGQALINYQQFEKDMLASLQATLAQPEKWQRFLARNARKDVDAIQLKKDMSLRAQQLQNRFAVNAVDVPYGHGRLDAFGQIFNTVAVEALNIPENARSPDAPTSFPVLWDASHFDRVQWNASAPNPEPGPLAQNATTALVVYGDVSVRGYGSTYPSSIKIQNLGYLQKQFYKLTAPQWPQDLAGKLNAEQIAQGQKIYNTQCLQCHSLVDATDPKRQIAVTVTPASEVGTDARMVNNFSEGTVKTGELEGKHFILWFGEKFAAQAARLDVVMHVTTGALVRHPWDSFRAVLKEYASNKKRDLEPDVKYYKARPINGIWASAPYLHNGSVPTVYDLLLPVAQRPSQFYVGNRNVDTQHLGNQITQVPGSSLFDTTLPGNANTGHEYGTQLSEPERMALLEYIKTL